MIDVSRKQALVLFVLVLALGASRALILCCGGCRNDVEMVGVKMVGANVDVGC